MMQGAITEADRKFVETWEHIASSGDAVIRLDPRGEERQELIVNRRQFMITTEERLITQDRIAEEKNDPFRNGNFRPVIVPDSVDKKSNPNALSDEEIQSLFASSDLAWDEWMKVLDSAETLRRMLDMAEKTDIPLRRYRQVERRLAEVKPKTRIVQKDQEEYEKLANQPQRPQRRRGGMSSDYR